MKRPVCRLRAKDVEIGQSYEVVISSRNCPVRIESIASPGVWLGTNRWTGREVYVVLADLIQPVTDVPGQRDGRKAAAGDSP